jgi:phosphate transport system substrate-binding protein
VKVVTVSRTKVLASSAGSLLCVGALLVTFGLSSPAAGAARPSSASLAITGAGSTFDAPFFTKAFYEYGNAHPGLRVDYAAIGSGGGIQQFQQGTVAFGATDVPMSSSEVAHTSGGPTLQVPVDLGGEAVAYNLAGVKVRLKMSGTILGDIFLGKIRQWNDPRIAGLNPGVRLPDEAITVVHRSDGSGTTYIFASYLADTSSAWARGPGVSKSIAWPTGVGGQGNAGVAGLVHEIPGAIGYVELAYAVEDHFSFFSLQNRAGNFITPSLATVAADAAHKSKVSATNFGIVDEPGANSYPIAGYSWLLLHQRATSVKSGQALQALFVWLTGQAQSIAGSLNYVPLPSGVRAEAHAMLAEMTGPGGVALAD